VSDLAARRAMGHRVGSDVFDLVYTLDSRLKKHLTPIARQIESEITDVKVVRRLFPDKIPATEIGRECWCTEADVAAFLRRTQHLQPFTEVVERSGVDYAAYPP